MTFLQVTDVKPATPAPGLKNEASFRGLAIAALILLTWAGSLIGLLRLDISNVHPVGITIALLWQTFLYTGLFITAHDAMHGVVCPQQLRLNHFIGALTLLVYGLFSYQELLRKHWQHHQFPASDRDPDYHDGQHDQFFAWYFHFMKGYWSWWRLVGLAIIFCGLFFGLQVPASNLFLFWVAPSLLSSLQLFYFGTFLTHREPPEGYEDAFHARSNYYSTFWSFLTCYHFGYHREHHQFPHVPWWQLPAIAHYRCRN